MKKKYRLILEDEVVGETSEEFTTDLEIPFVTKQEFILHHQFEQEDPDRFFMINPDNEDIYLVFNGSGEVIEEHGIEKNAGMEALITDYLDEHYKNQYDEIVDDYKTNGVKPQDFF